MIWFIYNVVVFCATPIWVPWMIWRTRQRSKGPDWKQRIGDLGFQLEKGKPRVWFHAVSVGEVVAALPILERLKERAPGVEIVLSVTTSTGHQVAHERASHLATKIIYFPIDIPLFALNAVGRVRPTVVAVMETELWMNFLWAAKALDAHTMLINGRISDRSFSRSSKLKFFYQELLKNVDEVLMQTQDDADRIARLGASNPEVLGNCKFDQAATLDSMLPEQWRAELGLSLDEPVVVVGSTRSEAEENLVLTALAKFQGRARVVFAPRQIERADAVRAAAEAQGWKVGLRSRRDTAQFLVLDTFGELASVYGIATVAIIGGGFDNLGGQNLLQPLALGVPVIHGPNMQNFREVSVQARSVGATLTARNSDELATCIDQWLSSELARTAAGRAGAEMIRVNLGASDRYAERIISALGVKG